MGVAHLRHYVRVPKTSGALAKMEHHVSCVIRALLDGE